jgi:MoxR-like ATPase
MSSSSGLKMALEECNRIFKGKEDQVKLAFICLISRGHLLIEDIPGVGKTTLAYLISHAFGLNMSRIQFTNDLLPTDILGTSIFDKKTSEFIFKRGPIFNQMVLADELNRASPKTQSALLQAMEERYVTFDGSEYQLESPFIVIATQNPIDSIGTNPLPESQLDRFLMSFSIGLPSIESEKEIILGSKVRDQIGSLKAFFDLNDLREISLSIEKVNVEEKLLDYMMSFLTELRTNTPEGRFLSVRAGQDLFVAMKSNAVMEGREYATHDDLKFIAPYILSHRLNSRSGLNDRREIIKRVLSQIAIR